MIDGQKVQVPPPALIPTAYESDTPPRLQNSLFKGLVMSPVGSETAPGFDPLSLNKTPAEPTRRVALSIPQILFGKSLRRLKY